jgi:hypothetical protein
VSKKANSEDKPAESEVHEVDLSAIPGFHVLQGKLHLGTYATREDAEAFIAQHLKPVGIEAEILEVE